MANGFNVMLNHNNMKQYEIELKRIEYGYVIVKANNEQDAIDKYKEQGGNEVFFPDNQEIKTIGTVTETGDFS